MLKKLSLLLILPLVLAGCQIGGYEIRKVPTVTENPQEPEAIPNSDLLSKCKSDFNYYVDIAEKKHGVSISLLDSKEVPDEDSLKSFYTLWGSEMDMNMDLQYNWEELDYPMVLLGIKFEGIRGQVPMVIACGSDGKLIEPSRQRVLNYGQILTIN